MHPAEIIPASIRKPMMDTAARALKLMRGPWPNADPACVVQLGSLTISGFLAEPLGVGRAGRLTADALRLAGFPTVEEGLRETFRHMFKTPLRMPGGPSGVWLIHANAPECELAFLWHRKAEWCCTWRIGYWVWETPVAPASWAQTADALHEIWAPSRFAAENIERMLNARRSGEPRQVCVMPHPVRIIPDRATPNAPDSSLGFQPGCVHALIIFDAHSSLARKNPFGAVDAWLRAFPVAAAGARLIIKAMNLDSGAQTARLRAAIAGRSDIHLLSSALSPEQHDHLMGAIDFVVSTHRSEGFGLTLAEAMARGKAVIATGWSGNLEFMDRASAVLLPYALVPILDPQGLYIGGQWADPDLDAASEAIRALVSDAALRRRLGREGRRRIGQLSEAWSRRQLNQMRFSHFTF